MSIYFSSAGYGNREYHSIINAPKFQNRGSGLQAPEGKGKNQLDGSVAAGKKMNGVIAYQVPEDWKTLEIKFSPSFWSNKSATFVATK